MLAVELPWAWAWDRSAWARSACWVSRRVSFWVKSGAAGNDILFVYYDMFKFGCCCPAEAWLYLACSSSLFVSLFVKMGAWVRIYD